MTKNKRIAINEASGFVPGLNAVLSGAAIAAHGLDWELVGIRDGFDGLLYPNLRGLKENVILGHLIPAGTSFKPYVDMNVTRNVELPELAGMPSDELTEAEITQAVQQALTGRG